MHRLTSVATVLAVLSVAAAGADEGRIPIYQPTAITAPGSYVLTRDITVTNGNVITIQASGVTFDLNGRTISSSNTSGNLIQIADGSAEVRIQNGRLSGGAIGINYVSSSNQTRVRIEQVEVSGTAHDGIHLAGAEYAEIVSCRVIRSAENGIFVSPIGTWFQRNSRFVGNSIISPGWNGLVIQQLQIGEVRDNLVSWHGVNLGNGTPGTGGAAILLTGTPESGGILVEKNVIGWASGIDDEGIRIDPSVPNNLVTGNVIKNVLYGIYVRSDGNRIVENQIGSIGYAGIRVEGSRNLIASNLVERVGACCLEFLNSNSHAYRDNMLRSTPGSSGLCGYSNTDAGGNTF